jgi:membrane protease YdiL (CAAX protease family)
MPASTPARPPEGRYEVYLFFVLACTTTWLLDLPLALAWARHVAPAPYALPLVGVGALGPTLAAFVLALRRRRLPAVFGRWRTNPVWILVALLTPFALHLPATAFEVALGGQPTHWFYPPNKPEYIAGMVVFSIGEEFGWRGFAYPRLAKQHGPVTGSLILGSVWGLWHLGMLFTPEKGAPEFHMIGVTMAELALYSVIFAWTFERGDRSMAVAIALHAGGHLDNVNRAPETEVRLRVLRFVVLVIAAAFAARSLAKKAQTGEAEPEPAAN